MLVKKRTYKLTAKNKIDSLQTLLVEKNLVNSVFQQQFRLVKFWGENHIKVKYLTGSRGNTVTAIITKKGSTLTIATRLGLFSFFIPLLFTALAVYFYWIDYKEEAAWFFWGITLFWYWVMYAGFLEEVKAVEKAIIESIGFVERVR